MAYEKKNKYYDWYYLGGYDEEEKKTIKDFINNFVFFFSINILVPFLIFFTLTMVYPRLRGTSNLQSGVCKFIYLSIYPIINLFLYR